MAFGKVVALGLALGLMLVVTSSALAGDAAKAKRDLMSAKDKAEGGRWDGFDDVMKRAVVDMEGLSDAERKPLLAEVEAIRALVTKSIEEEVTKRLDRAAAAEPGMRKLDTQRAEMRLKSDEAAYADPAALAKLKARLASLTGAPAPDATTTPPPATSNPPTTAKPTAGMSPDLQTAISRVRTANSMFDQGDWQFAARMLREAVGLVEKLPEADKAPVLADVAALSRKVEAAELKAQRDEEFRRIDEQVSRYVHTAEASIQTGVVSDPEWIDKSEQLLATHPAQTYLGAARVKEYQARLDATRAKLRTHNKTVAVERSADVLKELEEKVAADPFKGADERTANGIYNDLTYLGKRVLGEFTRVPKDEPEVKAVFDRVAAANAKIESLAGKWAMQKMEEQFAAGWGFAIKNFEGWEAEKLSADEAPRGRVEGLSKTTQAIRGTVYWLEDAQTKQTAEQHKDNAVVTATLASARKTLDAAAAKLDEGFGAVLSALEKAPMPRREADRYVAPQLMHQAKEWFAGTKYQAANVARAKALDDKWSAEVARLEKERLETLKTMTAAATAAWPGIAAGLAADSSFNPREVDQWKGKVVRIRGYYNRRSWDFDGQYGFAADVKGVPIGGEFAPHVAKAYQEVQEKSQWGVDDHSDWDVIAVVEGPGTIYRRVFTEWKDKDTREVLFKTESYMKEPCVRVRVIGVNAGPLAVGGR
ncbi:MAG: hypothetical protein JWN40_4335 [Phycisphaerales bacterium]|nr:hypothetical protein [Phycisphaerales bacterium]